MKLPIIETPSYTIDLPISGKTIKYRPYLVGEEVAFLTSLEMEEKRDIIESFFDVVKNCSDIEDIEDLYLVDFYFILLNIRTKSVEETMEVNKVCPECKNEEPMTIDILKTVDILNQNTKSKMLKVTDKIKVELKPTKCIFLKEISKLKDNKDFVYYSIYNSVSKIIFGTEVYKDFTEEDFFDNFLGKLTKKQLKIIIDGLSFLPILKGKIVSKCSSCDHEHEYIIEDIFDFLN